MKNLQIKSLAIVLLSLFSLSACDSNVVFKKFDDDFPESQWQKNDVRTYEFKLESAGNYDVAMLFSHVYDTPVENIPILMSFETPSGEIETLNITVPLRDTEAKYIGDCAGDYCDLEHIIIKDRKMAAGNYKISLANRFDYQYLPNVIGVGVKVVKSGNQ